MKNTSGDVRNERADTYPRSRHNQSNLTTLKSNQSFITASNPKLFYNALRHLIITLFVTTHDLDVVSVIKMQIHTVVHTLGQRICTYTNIQVWYYANDVSM